MSGPEPVEVEDNYWGPEDTTVPYDAEAIAEMDKLLSAMGLPAEEPAGDAPVLGNQPVLGDPPVNVGGPSASTGGVEMPSLEEDELRIVGRKPASLTSPGAAETWQGAS